MTRSRRGSAPPSVKDVARAAGVSVGTVSNVLNRPQIVQQDTRRRVEAAIAELGFTPNVAARRLRMRDSGTMGLVVLDITNPFFAALARGAEERADEAGISILVADSGSDPERERRHLAALARERVGGVLLCPVGDAEGLAALHDLHVPAVVVDRIPAHASGPAIVVDHVAGGELAGAHLMAAGRRHVVFVGGPLEVGQVADRLAGARRAIESAGARIDVLATADTTLDAGIWAGEQLRDSFLSRGVDAIFAANDLLAIGVQHALLRAGAGLRIPDDVALVGYDDIPFAAAAVVPITSVRQPAHAMGRAAVEVLLGADGAQSLAFTPELVVRESSGASST